MIPHAAPPIKPNAAKKKTNRPLSAYNLFYRYKRAKLIEAGCAGRADVTRVLSARAGLENYPQAALTNLSPAALDDLRRSNIRGALQKNLLSNDTSQRSHRKGAHGGFKLSFVEMNALVSKSWKEADEVGKQAFQELAQEGRRMYKKGLKEGRKASENDGHPSSFQSIETAIQGSQDVCEGRRVSVEACCPKAASSITHALTNASYEAFEPLPFQQPALPPLPAMAALEPLPFQTGVSANHAPPEVRPPASAFAKLDRSTTGFSYNPMFQAASVVTPPTVVKPSALDPAATAFFVDGSGAAFYGAHVVPTSPYTLPRATGVPRPAFADDARPRTEARDGPRAALGSVAEHSVSADDLARLAAALV